MAGIGHVKVISIDYRQAPEPKFPAASEDVAKVYQAVTATRDPLMSDTVVTHARMLKAGVDAHLFVQEGLGHAFLASMPMVPEAVDAYSVA
jgi:acetyl esterase/lipase